MQLKCSGCNNRLEPNSKNNFFYCCQPFKISKLYCLNCRAMKKSCNQCKKNRSITYKPIQKSEVDKYRKQNQATKVQQAQKIQQSKSQPMSVNNSTKPIQIKKTTLLQQCFYCTRNLDQMRISFYSHQKCKAKICYPCLYMIYNSQKHKLETQKNKQLDQVPLSLNCCKEPKNTLLSYQNLFKSDLCIFYGFHNPKRQLNFNINNRFRFCRMCFEKESQRQNKCPSLKFILHEIYELPPKECLFCQKQTKISDYLNKIYQKAFNRKLCLNCFDSYGDRFQNTLDLLKSWKPNQNISKLCKGQADLNYFYCSEPTCHRNVICIFQTHKCKIVNMKVEFDLVQWRDNKKYCGICLYFKYENKRCQFILKKQKGLCSQIQTEKFQASKQGYQYLFSDKCMICLTYPTNQNRQRLLVDVNGNQKKNQEEYKLSCQYCQKCLCLLSLENIEGNYLKIKNEMCTRDLDLPKILREIKSQKQFLVKTYSKLNVFRNGEFNKFWQLSEGQKGKKTSEKQNILQDKKKGPERLSQKDNSKVDKANPKESPNSSESKYQQFDDIVDSEKLMTKEAKNITNANSNQAVSQKIETSSPIQPLKIQFPKIQIILSEELQTFSVTENYSLTNDQNQSRDNELNDEEENNNFRNYLKKIQIQYTTPQMVKSICDLNYEEMQAKVISSNTQYETTNDNDKGEYRPNKHDKNLSQLNATNSKSSNSLNRDLKCKMLKCRSKENESPGKLLNLGMLCDNCFIAYLMGMVDLKDEVDPAIYNQQLKSATEFMKSVEENNA